MNKNKNIQYQLYFFSLIFFISILFVVLFIYNRIIYFYNLKISEEKSKSLSDIVRIKSLYNTSINFDSSVPIIGQISIKKIHLNYPIFSYTTDNLLKTGICRLAGPMPNRDGNLCLAGHNYNNEAFFSNLENLQLKDIITINDNSNLSINYSIYKIFEVDSDNTSILSQTDDLKLVTLITCNNKTNRRLVIKAKEIE